MSRDRDRTKKAVEALLAMQKKAGRVVGVRRQLYVTLPEGVEPGLVRADPYVLASRMADDAIVAYGAALDMHLAARANGAGAGADEPGAAPVRADGAAGSATGTGAGAVGERALVTFLSNVRVRPADYGDHEFRAVGFPVALRDKRVEEHGVTELPRAPYAAPSELAKAHGPWPVRVTTPERTLVDLLDRPDLGGGFDLLWNKLPDLGRVDLDGVVAYVRLLNNATTAAKVGFYLDGHRQATGAQDGHLAALEAECPRRPHYLERSLRRSGRLVKPWNLVAPRHLLD
ncbi:MAG: hypothetical protein H0S85_02630 [Desulfovibrionaceae bacterium]|nr:hypothetical protein [Desulfovibrionaceae bacterium]